MGTRSTQLGGARQSTLELGGALRSLVDLNKTWFISVELDGVKQR